MILPQAGADNPLVRRQRITQASLDAFRGKPAGWKHGRNCIHLVARHLKAAGHKVPPVPQLRSLLAARRELARRGCNTVAELLDSLGLERIAPAAMLPGDLAAAGSPDGIGGAFVCVGAGMVLGWREDLPEFAVLAADLGQLAGAWRVGSF